MALGHTQSLKEIGTGVIFWENGGKDGRRGVLTVLPHSCACSLEILGPQFPGALRAFPGMLWDNFGSRNNWPNCALLLEEADSSILIFIVLNVI